MARKTVFVSPNPLLLRNSTPKEWHRCNVEGTAYHSTCGHPNVGELDFRSIGITDQCKNAVD